MRQLPWSHNLVILGQAKRPEEREFYARMAIRERWSQHDLERQFRVAAFERAVLGPAKASPAVSRVHPAVSEIFKDSYVVEFLELPRGYAGQDLHQALIELSTRHSCRTRSSCRPSCTSSMRRRRPSLNRPPVRTDRLPQRSDPGVQAK